MRGGGNSQTKRRSPGQKAVHVNEFIHEDLQDQVIDDSGASSSQIQALNARNVKSKVSDFARFVGDVADENEKLKKELTTTQVQLTNVTDRSAATKAEHDTTVEHLKQIISEQDASIVTLRNERIDLQIELNSVLSDSNELLNLRSLIASAKSQLKDYITLETTGVSLITTSGQVCF
jgi:septal ring factor EnvC (AmiA/AmiB activator)